MVLSCRCPRGDYSEKIKDYIRLSAESQIRGYKYIYTTSRFVKWEQDLMKGVEGGSQIHRWECVTEDGRTGTSSKDAHAEGRIDVRVLTDIEWFDLSCGGREERRNGGALQRQCRSILEKF